jgi:hypothetical protein
LVTSAKKWVEIINSRYLRTLFEADFNSNIERLLTDLKQHRLYNFIEVIAIPYFEEVLSTCRSGLRKKDKV